MKLPIYQVDAFSSRVFAGNPAAVVPLESWLPKDVMQAIAAENNLAETAFFVSESPGNYGLRWFTPTTEVQLCGHATLASAWVLFHCLGVEQPSLGFATASGTLRVSRQGDRLAMSLPRYDAAPCPPPALAAEALGVEAQTWLSGPNYMAVLENEAAVRNASPDMTLLGRLPDRCVIVTAIADSDEVDFVSRFFAPNFGIPEDPVTGSAHCMLAPFWAEQLNKPRLVARQISARGGELVCESRDDHVLLEGQAALYLTGEISVPQ